MKSVKAPGGVKIFLPRCDLTGHPILNVKLCSKATLYYENEQHSNATL